MYQFTIHKTGILLPRPFCLYDAPDNDNARLGALTFPAGPAHPDEPDDEAVPAGLISLY